MVFEIGFFEISIQGKEDKKKRKYKDKLVTMSFDEFNQMSVEKFSGFFDGLFYILVYVLNMMI